MSFPPCSGRVFQAVCTAFLAVVSCSVAFGQSGAAPAQAGSALVKQYCAGCHSAKTRAGNLALEGLDLAKIGDDAATWEKVLRKVGAKQMPPLNVPHPDAAAQQQFLTYLETELDRAAATHPNPGRATIHRLNRAEYSNAVRDLFSLDVRAGNTLPLDDTGYGFDNIGDVLSLSPVLLERYLTASRMVSRLAVADTDLKPEINSFDLGRGRGARNEAVSEDLPFGSGLGLSFTYTFPVDADYTFKVRLPAPAPGFGETAAPVGQVLELKVPVKAGVRHVGISFMRSNAVPETLPVFGNGRGGGGAGVGRGGAPGASMAHLDLRVDGARLKMWDVPEGPNGPRFNDLSIGGPYDVKQQSESASRKIIFGVCRPGGPKEEDVCARKTLTALARRAYRRPVTDSDIKPPHDFLCQRPQRKVVRVRD